MQQVGTYFYAEFVLMMTDDSHNTHGTTQEWRLYLTEKGSDARIVLADGKTFEERGFCVRFEKTEDDQPVFNVRLLSEDPFCTEFSVNNRLLYEGDTCSLVQGSQVVMLGHHYDVSIRRDDISVSVNPMRRLYWETAFSLHPGRRSRQEDALGFAHRETSGGREALWLVADGVTHAEAGDYASRFAVDLVLWQFFNSSGSVEQRLRSAINTAGQRLVHWGKTLTEYRRAQQPGTPEVRAGTTLAAVVLDQRPRGATGLVRNDWHIALVGDSVVYLRQPQRQGDLRLFQAREHFEGSHLKIALGKESLTETNIKYLRMDAHSADLLLLATDGVSDAISFQEMQPILDGHAPDVPQDWQHLPAFMVNLAVQHPAGGDNAAAVLVRTGHLEPENAPQPHSSDPQVCIGLTQSYPELPAPEQLYGPQEKKTGRLGRWRKRL